MLNKNIILERDKSIEIIDRLAGELFSKHKDFSNTVIIGLQPRGIKLANKIKSILEGKYKIENLKYGVLDITFFRDDFRHKEVSEAGQTDISFLIENKNTILIDDVLYTGRTIRSAMSALQSFGRYKSLELMTFIDRKDSRELPIQANYIGMELDMKREEKIRFDWEEEYPEIYILNKNV